MKTFLALVAFTFVSSNPVKSQFYCCCGDACLDVVSNAPGLCDFICPFITGGPAVNGTPEVGGCAPIDPCVPLPVELHKFEGSINSMDHIMLFWETAQEINNKGFEIQRANGAELQWETIGFVQGKGTTEESSGYRFVDDKPYPGINYYRLKQIDLDGTYTLTKTVEINRSNGASAISVWPTMAKEHLFVRLNEESNDASLLQVFDNLGRKVIEKQTEDPVHVLSLGNLSKGQYTLIVTFNRKKLTERFFVVE